MILRRISEHLRQQHWTGFVIEFVIVVLGVFIGLQANNWNDARRERAREQAYLNGIAADLDESIASIRRSIELSNERADLDQLLIRAASDPEVVRAEPGRFIYALARGGWTFAPTIRSTTFDTIKSTGDLGAIRDRQLVLDLMKFHSDVTGQAQWASFRAYCQEEYTRRAAGILSAGLIMQAPANSNTIPSIDLDDALGARKRMLERTDFIAWLPTTLFYRATDLQAAQTWLAEAESLRTRVRAGR